MILGTKARYAVMAMVDMASRNHSNPISLSDLSESQEIPLPYLEQIFSKLRKAGLVQSVRGPGGGYLLSRDSHGISIVEIVEAVDESLKMTRCNAETTGGCIGGKVQCKTHHLWEGLGQQIYSYLDKIHLDEVVNRN